MEPEGEGALYELFAGPVFLSAFFSWFLAQVLKAVIESLRARSTSSRDVAQTIFWKTGGMPSSHASLVTALATAIGFRYGVSSPLFTLALFYGILIIRDALGVRRAAGMQAQELNRIGLELRERFGVEFNPVREVNGHTAGEVSVGVLLGFFIATGFSLL
ncbi:MAG: divergent PAP2 family protein [Spirochaetaceae bacterium]